MASVRPSSHPLPPVPLPAANTNPPPFRSSLLNASTRIRSRPKRRRARSLFLPFRPSRSELLLKHQQLPPPRMLNRQGSRKPSSRPLRLPSHEARRRCPLRKCRKNRSRRLKNQASPSCRPQNRVALPQAGIMRRPKRKAGDRKPLRSARIVLHSVRIAAGIAPAGRGSGMADRATHAMGAGMAVRLGFSARIAPRARIGAIAAQGQIATRPQRGPSRRSRLPPRTQSRRRNPAAL